ncbi:methyltransferase domain-containing protein [Candidatus Dependentiae bacterium]|nr:methyltransferase domain-containing protein [Candidatus Dependentiae bacterium]
MGKKRKYDSKEAGLAVSLIMGKYFLKAEDLHYGYWTEDMELDISNMVKAQAKYSEQLISHIPEGVKTILDVGGGAGMTTKRLLEKGYKVDCLTPSPDLAAAARKNIGKGSDVFETKFEDLKTDKKYDLILFSESFQYIPTRYSIPKSLKILNKNGYILISDFFKTGAPGQKSALSGGHTLSKFLEFIEDFPLELIKDVDITDFTAPNMDIVNGFIIQVAQPMWNIIFKYFDMNYPKGFKVLKKIYRKKIEKTEKKFFAGRLNGEQFKIHKTYRIMLYKGQ